MTDPLSRTEAPPADESEPASLAAGATGEQVAAGAQSALDDRVTAAQSRVRSALGEIDGVAGTRPEEQVAAFAAAHRTLQATLSGIDNE